MSEFVFLASGNIPGLVYEGQVMRGFALDTSVPILERMRAFAQVPREQVRALVTLLSEKVDAEVLHALRALFPQLGMIANYAVGFNNIDVGVARELGIRVTNTPGVLTDATANIALALMLMTSRRLFEGAQEIATTGRFPGWGPTYMLGVDLCGKTLGIVGMGAIGKLVAQRAEAFGMRVVALQSLRSSPSPDNDGFVRLEEQEFLASIDVLSFHTPLTPETRGWLNKSRLEKLKKGTIVINTARGEMIDEVALAQALNSGHIRAAGLDVFCHEPILSDALRGAKNLVVLPHLGSATEETRTAMGELVMRSLQAFASATDGARIPCQVN